jgi:glycosyltransferase involved in cell wall biosynthesis
MISFIVPTLNEGEHLRKTLEGLKQYTGNGEIIVSDGGSKDETAKIAREYTDKVLVYSGEKKQGISGGRNAGAAAASGEILVFVDADVYIPNINQFFAKVEKIFENQKIVAMTTYYRVWPEMATWADKLVFKTVGLLYVLYNNVFHVGGSGGELQIIRAAVFRQVGGFDGKIKVGEDNELFWRLAKVGRTHFERSLFIYHTNRRGHQIGWPRLIYDWTINGLYVLIFRRAKDDEWKVIR